MKYAENTTAKELAALSAALETLEGETQVDKTAADLKNFLGLMAESSHNPLIATFCKFLVMRLIEVARETSAGMTKNWNRVGARLKSDRRKLVAALQSRNVTEATAMAARYNRHTQDLVGKLLAGDSHAASPGRDACTKGNCLWLRFLCY